ncbi:hypothetical protein [Phytoactinopolyspora halophila]|uniref:hypothetical protein n=1 Tax=Phytoactinopolyspora halophila TaxID=1981511 RepID=UPI000F503019|nr:hypothetical protein [Phytoactinopolyspora halophila]
MDGHELRNLTPHPITFVDRGGEIKGQLPIDTTAARAVPGRPARRTDVAGVPVPVYVLPPRTHVVDLPPPGPSQLLVVSELVARTAIDRNDLVFPYGHVRDSTGRVIGCRALARYAHVPGEFYSLHLGDDVVSGVADTMTPTSADAGDGTAFGSIGPTTGR